MLGCNRFPIVGAADNLCLHITEAGAGERPCEWHHGVTYRENLGKGGFGNVLPYPGRYGILYAVQAFDYVIIYIIGGCEV